MKALKRLPEKEPTSSGPTGSAPPTCQAVVFVEVGTPVRERFGLAVGLIQRTDGRLDRHAE